MPSPTDGKAAITALLRAYGTALAARSVAQAVALYTADGVILAPHNVPAVGTAELTAAYTRILGAIQLDIAFDIAEIEVMADKWAFARTTAAGTKVWVRSGVSEDHRNQELFVLRREGGEWRIARYAFSSMKPLGEK